MIGLILFPSTFALLFPSFSFRIHPSPPWAFAGPAWGPSAHLNRSWWPIFLFLFLLFLLYSSLLCLHTWTGVWTPSSMATTFSTSSDHHEVNLTTYFQIFMFAMNVFLADFFANVDNVVSIFRRRRSFYQRFSQLVFQQILSLKFPFFIIFPDFCDRRFFLPVFSQVVNGVSVFRFCRSLDQRVFRPNAQPLFTLLFPFSCSLRWTMFSAGLLATLDDVLSTCLGTYTSFSGTMDYVKCFHGDWNISFSARALRNWQLPRAVPVGRQLGQPGRLHQHNHRQQLSPPPA